MSTIRGATLTLLLLSLAARAAHGASCPSAGSSGSISCYKGATFAGTYPAGGVCTCLCGASASVADYDYAGGSGTNNNPVTQFMAASSAACSNTLCTTKFPSGCPASAYVNGTYSTAAQMIAAKTPKSLVAGADTICIVQTATCSVANPCGLGLTSGVVTSYGALTGGGGVTAAATCTIFLAGQSAGVTVNRICTTNNCNAPGASSAAAGALSGATNVAAAMVVAVLAVAAM